MSSLAEPDWEALARHPHFRELVTSRRRFVWWVTGFYTLYLVGTNMEYGYWYNLGLAGAAVFFAWQQWLIRHRKPAECFKGFLNNHYVGLSVFIGILLEYALRPAALTGGGQ